MENQELKKGVIRNLIILDKSGSMQSIREQAVEGVNKTIMSIKEAYKNDSSIEQRISVLLFCGCKKHYIIKDKVVDDVNNISMSDYEPCCTTPLYDAIGIGIKDIESAQSEEKEAVSVTIITDGYENASTDFNLSRIRELINAKKNKGWMFAYIGADHDVESVAFSLSITNTLSFQKEDAEVDKMFAKQNAARGKWRNKVADIFGSKSKEGVASCMCELATSYKYFEES